MIGGKSASLCLQRSIKKNHHANVCLVIVLFVTAVLAGHGCSCRRENSFDSTELPQKKTYETESNDLVNLEDLDATNPKLPPQVGGIEIPPDIDEMPRIENETTDSLPSRFDWRDEGVVSPVRKQFCGDCWAFAACAVAESVHAIDTGTLHDISEQWLIDCNHEGWSCIGGQPPFAYFVDQTDRCEGIGAVLEESRPYLGYEEDCACDVRRLKPLASWGVVSTQRNPAPVDAVKRTIRDHGPVWAGMFAGIEFIAYRSGIFNLREELKIFERHAVVITGWDDSQGKDGVWLVRNSWGTNWGEQGTARVEYGVGGLGEILVVCLTNKAQSIDEDLESGGEESGGEESGGEESAGEESGGEESAGEESGGEETSNLLRSSQETPPSSLDPSEAAERAGSLMRQANRKKNAGEFNDAFDDALEGWKIVQEHKKVDVRCSELGEKLQELLKTIEPHLDDYYPENKKYQVD